MAQITANKSRAKSHSLSQRILKAMSVLVSAQGLGILCSIIRSKLVAVWVGTAGMGIFGLYNSAIEMICSIGHLGMRNSTVKDVATTVDNPSMLRRVVTAIRRWSGALGLLTSLLTMAFAPFLSQWTFGNDGHTWGFIYLSIVTLLTAITNGELAILQGRALLSRLAKASAWGAAGGLAISVPLFYYLRYDSIVPSIIAYAIATFIAVIALRDKEVKSLKTMTLRQTIAEGRNFILLGTYMTIAAVLTMLSNYIFLAWLNSTADLATVGQYNAGFTLINRYIGLLFSSITMEYYPRLASSVKSALRTSVFVAHEVSLTMWILIPLICVFISLSPLIVYALYSSDFQPIVPFISIAIAGNIFRAISWCMSFVMIAKGDGKIYLVTETLSVIVGIILNIAGFKSAGLTGLGIAYVAWYIVYTIIVAVVYWLRYHLHIGKKAVASAAVAILCCSIILMTFFLLGQVAAIILSVVFSTLAIFQIKKLT